MDELTQDEVTFVLWTLGFVNGMSEKMDKQHQHYVNEHHDNVFEKIGNIYELINRKKEGE